MSIVSERSARTRKSVHENETISRNVSGFPICNLRFTAVPWPSFGASPSPDILRIRGIAGRIHVVPGVVMPQAHQMERRSRKEERLETRVTPAQKRLIERAAALPGTSVPENETPCFRVVILRKSDLRR